MDQYGSRKQGGQKPEMKIVVGHLVGDSRRLAAVDLAEPVFVPGARCRTAS